MFNKEIMKKTYSILLLACYFFIFLIPESNRFYISFDRSDGQVLILSLLNFTTFGFLLANNILVKNLSRSINERIILSYTIYIGISLISIIFSENINESIIIFSKYFTYLFALISVFSLSLLIEKKFILYFLYCSALVLLLESSSIVYNAVDLVFIQGIEFQRDNYLLRSFAGNINITANSIVFKMAALYYLIFQTKNLKTLSFTYIILFLSFSALFILLTRSAFLSCAIITLLFIIWMRKKHIYRSGLILISIFVAFLFVQSSFNQSDQNEITDRIASIQINTEDDSINARLRYYSHALKSIAKNPLTGIGVGTWKIKSIEYDLTNITGYTVPFHAHNDFLQIAAEIGLIGFAFYALIFLIPLYTLLKRILNNKASNLDFLIILMLFAYIADSMLNFPIDRPITHIYLIFILVAYMVDQKTKFNPNEIL